MSCISIASLDDVSKLFQQGPEGLQGRSAEVRVPLGLEQAKVYFQKYKRLIFVCQDITFSLKPEDIDKDTSQLSALVSSVPGRWLLRCVSGDKTYFQIQRSKAVFERTVEAAKKGDPKALYDQARYYEMGCFVPKTIEKAFMIYRHSANLGNTKAMVKVGNWLESAKRADEAIAWYKRASDLGDPDGMYNYARCLKDGIGVKEEDYGQAAKLFLAAASAGQREACFQMGQNCQYGWCCPEDVVAARGWYEKAGDMGHAGAIFQLATFYYKGNGVAKDGKKAFALFREAADLGDINALHQLGVCFEKGVGVEKDLKQAEYFYKLAKSRGYSEACAHYSECDSPTADKD